MQSGCYIPFHEPPSVTSTPTPTVSFSTEQSHLIDQAIQGLLNQVYQYCTISFGLASSPFVFTKVCRPILEHFYSQSFRISAYLDDWILAASTKQLAIQQVLAVVALLQQLGWMVNFKKSILTPTQQLGHLGFVSNTSTMTASLPMKKLRDIRRSIKQALDHPHRQSTRVTPAIRVDDAVGRTNEVIVTGLQSKQLN
ncbi:hypothetical protein RO3G_14751 [Rhizopus delemar RA 99-880]|uniref:Reverse transcriptase domain-containing protein n=1 Tax=Rhizopus delemar (strain RA 99-880 / ATCC MYA-4621 / FGSC 9543 / NRRL 43880) TaxID=246409 RepID=I1CNL0_RHIO9|nr:hypothetical protein RO3G_14751 [Rhizopus delemar RA 99-880]|eukprot:EIE90040.1 hypothetical protein RO3G_14751 [Rhizopus delemar RA 99-880]